MKGMTPEMKKKKAARWLAAIMILLGAAGLVIAGVGIAGKQLAYGRARSEYAALRDRVQPETTAEPEAERAEVDLALLKEANPDFVGWIEIPGTGISYPVVQGSDNARYLHTTFSGAYNAAGSIFLDHRSSPDFQDANTVIFGHNMLDGSMFSQLTSYQDEEFLRSHSRILLYTDAGVLEYEIFRAEKVLEDDAIYQIVGGGVEDQMAAYLNGTQTDGERFLTLSTCTNDLDGRERYLVMAKQA